MNELNHLEKNIASFLRKFYLSSLIRGLLVGLGSLVLLLSVLVSIEYFVYMSSLMRTVLFYGYLLSSALVLFFFVLKPILQYAQLMKGLSLENAAKIIGEKVPGVGDRLTNTLELKKALKEQSSELIKAGLTQKALVLDPFDFSKGVSFSENRPYLKYLFLPLVLCVAVVLLWPNAFSEGTSRIISYSTEFERPAPFRFVLDEANISTVQGKDFLLSFEIEGEYVPNDVFILLENKRYLVRKENQSFKYLFKNPRKTALFSLSADGFESKTYELKVLSQPKILKLILSLEFPSHVGLEDKQIEYTGPLELAKGTKVNWLINSSNLEQLLISNTDTSFDLNASNAQTSFQSRIQASEKFLLIGSSAEGFQTEPYEVELRVIEDQVPKIDASWLPDTLLFQNFFFNGNISDDYGLSKLQFEFKSEAELYTEEIMINPGLPVQDFYHSFNLDTFNSKPGSSISFRFRVWDNDVVSGPKMSQSQSFSIKIPDPSELRNKEKEQNENAMTDLSSGLDQAKELQKEMKRLRSQLLNKKNLEWNDKEALKNLMQKQKKLQEQMNSMAQEQESMRKRREKLSPQDERLIEKQKQIEDLMKNLKDDRLEKLLKDMEKALEEMQKDKAQEKLEDLEKANDDLEKEMERTLELLKQLEFEQKLEDNIKALEELKKKQDDLSKDPQAKTEDQQKLNEEFKKLEEELQEMKEKNEELDRPNKLPEDLKEKSEDIKESMKESSDQMEKNNSSKAKQQQKQSSEQMEELADDLKALQKMLEEEKPMEDLNALRRLLENLIQLSFNQEELIDKVGRTSFNDPAFREITQEQKKLKDDTKIVEDSLFALSKRLIDLAPTVNKEMALITTNLEKALKAMTELNFQQTQSRQQYVMTSFNNLALILDASIQNAQQQMSKQKFGNKSCSKPGAGKKPSASEMKKKQEALKQAMEELQKKMDGGKNPKGKKEGDKKGEGGMSKELSKLAAEQAAIREQIRQLYESLDKGDNGGGKNLKEIQKLMEQTENDLINKQLSIETINRQEDIITRLLESEKAEREREFDKKRESKEGNYSEERNIFDLEQYKRLKQKESELLRTVPPNLSPYYKQKVSEYFSR